MDNRTETVSIVLRWNGSDGHGSLSAGALSAERDWHTQNHITYCFATTAPQLRDTIRHETLEYYTRIAAARLAIFSVAFAHRRRECLLYYYDDNRVAHINHDRRRSWLAYACGSCLLLHAGFPRCAHKTVASSLYIIIRMPA